MSSDFQGRSSTFLNFTGKLENLKNSSMAYMSFVRITSMWKFTLEEKIIKISMLLTNFGTIA